MGTTPVETLQPTLAPLVDRTQAAATAVVNAAIAVARRQVAKLFERRAAASLGRLRAAQQAQSAR